LELVSNIMPIEKNNAIKKSCLQYIRTLELEVMYFLSHEYKKVVNKIDPTTLPPIMIRAYKNIPLSFSWEAIRSATIEQLMRVTTIVVSKTAISLIV